MRKNCKINSFKQRPYACQLPGCTKRYTDPSSLRKHVKNHDHKGRRKSHKDSSGNKSSKRSSTVRRTCSESSALTCATTPSTPLTPHLNSHQPQQKFDFDDVFEDDQQTSKNNAMNFDEMSNCLITLMDHPSLNEISSTNDSSCMDNSSFKYCENYDNLNYVEQNDFGILYFT